MSKVLYLTGGGGVLWYTVVIVTIFMIIDHCKRQTTYRQTGLSGVVLGCLYPQGLL